MENSVENIHADIRVKGLRIIGSTFLKDSV